MLPLVTTLTEWVQGARPKTLGAALSPVYVGSGAALLHSQAHLGKAVLAATVAVALQVGVNYANDYSDGIRGTDDDRVGPMRLVGSGAASAKAVLTAALSALVVAVFAGCALVAWSGQWWLLGVGVACVLAAWYYTGGNRPYGYAGLGEVSVFIFFGPVAALGTMYTQVDRVSLPALFGSVSCGVLAVAILLANNIRDVAGDATSGKRTLAVRIGDRNARRLFAGMVAVAASSCAAAAYFSHSPAPLLGLVPIVSLVRPARAVLRGAHGPELITVLGATGRATLWFGLFLALGFAYSGSA